MSDIASPLPFDPRSPGHIPLDRFVQLRVLEWAILKCRHHCACNDGGRVVHDLLDAIHNTPAHILGEFEPGDDLYEAMYAAFDRRHPDPDGGPIAKVMRAATAEYRQRFGGGG